MTTPNWMIVDDPCWEGDRAIWCPTGGEDGKGYSVAEGIDPTDAPVLVAAPDMKEALEKLLGLINPAEPNSVAAYVNYEALLKSSIAAARAALAKADGK